ncbi:DNA-binding transcriptional LysR family regulator [Labrenzia sp. EL_208]|uniref:Gcv operon activator n=1 Tax=Roseibium album TaxID=311410 RepID=A0A0M7AZA2_9HYPH|nr:LysR substrate-binding domain-containing protein [Roseibium album]MBG6144674.1 DNA-binding transcriptional LysR family regulator [Labrenzia sp. EL_142]MBG6161717.1 DNA-binding transcriptional LysR family regulator [Labrenzia sp. EL_195]MBG6175306.1 DNA-binding transcriptional LysR family regulator [Labrenzia sp. EL_132]MBG6229918.1 DNA-binding transcriptional LysR family regulator [Labrenzia sp. EL_208]CTQ61503.1 Gcv operon activator [Roseibium album]
MQNLWKIVGSPRYILIFEAAARHGSFTRAAAELNVQQPAVSAAVKRLEQALGAPLFRRSHKKVELTPAGARFYAETSKGLHQILEAAHAVQAGARNAIVTLCASTAFNTYWMMPRLRTLRDLHPNIDLRLQSSDREPDIDDGGITLAIRRGDGRWPGCHAALIAEETIYPIASPALMTAAELRHKADILGHTLIHLEEPVRERPSWKDWFDAQGCNVAIPPSGLRLNDYALVLNAAISGEGIAFGWNHLARPLVRKKLLNARMDWSWRTGMGFYLVWSKSRPLSENAERVRKWFVSAAAIE